MKVTPDVLIGGSIMIAGVGIAGAATPTFLASTNTNGIQRWIPTMLAVLLVLAAIGTRRAHDWILRPLAALWAVGGACFAAPGLRQLGIDLNLWPLLVALSIPLAGGAVFLPAPRRIRAALAAGAALPFIIVVVLALPAGPALDAGAYGLIMATAGFSVRVASTEGRTNEAV